MVLIAFSANLLAQENRQLITGKVFNDSVLVSSIHIINKNTKQGTISNHKGIFKIPVKINDTLQLSGIQFNAQMVIIRKNHIENKAIRIFLSLKTNELEEIEIKQNPLSGNIVSDLKNVKIESKIAYGVLDFSDIDFKPDIIGDDGDSGKPPDASKLTNPHIPIGLTLATISLGKPFKKKTPPVQVLIRKEFGDDFFIKNLSIPLIHIDFFLNHCKNKGLTKLYAINKKLEFTDAMIKESKSYLKKINNED
ncbi:peptidase associated/transthyretin-like domain-containing protein [Aureibaculum conchae]|uniref:hypothetical protein n=1 Tax=Aureibaculum sp. 2308TA14-22 TaxID=3108392 RepID=UPI003392CFC4